MDGRKVAVADDPHPGVCPVEVDNVACERLSLRVRPGIFRRLAVRSHSSGVDDVPGYSVVASRAIRYFPRVHESVFVVPDQPLYRPVLVDKVRISYLLPAPASLRGRGGVPPPDVGGRHLAPFGGCGAMDNQILQSLFHCEILS